MIVTSRYHMPRTLHEFSAALPDITLIAYPVDQNGIDLSGWWRHPRTASLLHREYTKNLASLVTTHLFSCCFSSGFCCFCCGSWP